MQLKRCGDSDAETLPMQNNISQDSDRICLFTSARGDNTEAITRRAANYHHLKSPSASKG